MDLAILEPSILYISKDDWFDEEERDNYLEHFDNMLDGVHTNENISLAWSYQFEELLWTSPQQLPWRQDKCWSNTLMPFIYQRMRKNAEFIEVTGSPVNCKINPNIYYDREDFYLLFRGLIMAIHNMAIHKQCAKIIICFGLKNIPPKNHEFSVNDEFLSPTPIFVSSSEDFLSLIDVAENYWPTSAQDSESLKKGISIILSRDYGKDSICEFSFAKKFVKKLLNTIDDREKILNSIAKRLSMTKAEAGKDGGFQDETIDDIGRFRVTLSKRIHYKEKDGKIEFLMFYDEGKHDDGL